MASINILNQETKSFLQKISDAVNDCQKTADHTLTQLQVIASPGPIRRMAKLAQTQVNFTNGLHGVHVAALSTQQIKMEDGRRQRLNELGARIQGLEKLLQQIVYVPQTSTPTSAWPSTCAPPECSRQHPSSIYYYVPASRSAVDFKRTSPIGGAPTKQSAFRWRAPMKNSAFKWRAPTNHSAADSERTPPRWGAPAKQSAAGFVPTGGAPTKPSASD